MTYLDAWYFNNPKWFFSLLLVPILAYLIFRVESSKNGFWKVTHLSDPVLIAQSTQIKRLRMALYTLAFIGISSLLISLTQPYNINYDKQNGLNKNEGIDIILTIDISKSMLENDFIPNRIEVAKKVASSFVQGRKYDRIGLVVYAGEAFTLCPPTTDYRIILNKIKNISPEINLADGTAIGIGLGTAVARLRTKSKASQVIILLTDGSNNSGEIAPIEAATLAKEKGIRVYTIGMGDNTQIINNYNQDTQKTDIHLDEATLKQISRETGGQYFHASNEEVLTEIYDKINDLEKKELEIKNPLLKQKATPEIFIWAGLICISIFWFLNITLFNTYE